MNTLNDGDKPIFHVAPRAGWVNDPNGPFMYKGKYHLFYQHLPEGCEWAFGLVWGHAVSSDLVQWHHLPHALEPSPDALDADGCFSGCATVDTDGRPVILYTGVRLRAKLEPSELPPSNFDLNLPFVESQIAAVPADEDDGDLVAWVKDSVPFLALPPPDLQLTGWRDPFVVERPCAANGHEWVVLIGSGLKGVGGTCLVYRTPDLRTPSAWRYDGLLCSGDGETGAVWECPLIAELSPLPPGLLPQQPFSLGLGGRRHSSAAAHHDGAGGGRKPGPGGAGAGADLQHRPLWCDEAVGGAAGGGQQPQQQHRRGKRRHFYTISPDACTNATIYWLGDYEAGRFDMAGAAGPFQLDLGNVLYAPNVMVDDAGRVLLWSWLQEKRTVGAYDYAGCMGVPRMLFVDPESDRLWQLPVPELNKLRSGAEFRASEVPLPPGAAYPVPSVSGAHLDLCLTLLRGASAAVGVMLRAWDSAGGGGAAVVYHWDERLLEVAFEALDPSTMQFSLAAPGAQRFGGELDMRPGEPLELRLLIDGSCVEVFTGTGQVLSTRVYRGAPAGAGAAGGSGVEVFAVDGPATLARIDAYEMASVWRAQEAQQLAAAEAAFAAADAAPAAGGVPASLALDLAAAIEKAQSRMASRPASRVGSLAASLGGGAAAASLVAERLHALQLGCAPSTTGPLSPPRVMAGGGDAWANDADALPPEEEMCADIFLLEGVS